jgi:phage baseplate assembly protein W
MAYENKVIGIDLKLGIDGDIVVSNAGNYETVDSHRNMLQSARNSVLTPQGSDLYNLEFGSILNVLIGQPNTPDLRMIAASDVKRVLLSNPKIKEVPMITTRYDDNNFFSIECSIVPIDENNSYNFVIPVQL